MDPEGSHTGARRINKQDFERGIYFTHRPSAILSIPTVEEKGLNLTDFLIHGVVGRFGYSKRDVVENGIVEESVCW
jgi:hypothetical protein